MDEGLWRSGIPLEGEVDVVDDAAVQFVFDGLGDGGAGGILAAVPAVLRMRRCSLLMDSSRAAGGVRNRLLARAAR